MSLSIFWVVCITELSHPSSTSLFFSADGPAACQNTPGHSIKPEVRWTHLVCTSSGSKLRWVGLWSTISRIQPILFVTPVLRCLLLGCPNAGVWMTRCWRSAPTSVWVNHFLLTRERKRDDILGVWMAAESSPNPSPNPPTGSGNWILSNAHTSSRPEPDQTWRSGKLRQHLDCLDLQTQTAPHLKPHMETQSEMIRASCCCFSRHSGLPLVAH